MFHVTKLRKEYYEHGCVYLCMYVWENVESAVWGTWNYTCQQQSEFFFYLKIKSSYSKLTLSENTLRNKNTYMHSVNINGKF